MVQAANVLVHDSVFSDARGSRINLEHACVEMYNDEWRRGRCSTVVCRTVVPSPPLTAGLRIVPPQWLFVL
jgi:hypothetical protein